MGGFFTQSGVLLDAAAAYFGTSVPVAATLFSSLTGGNLAGLVACMFIFDVLPIRRVLLLGYVVLLAGVGLVCVSHLFAVGAVAIGMCGFGAGVGLSAGAVVIAKTFAQRSRAIAFLGTDCTFSLSGYVFPALAANAIALGWVWQSGYIAVALIAVAVAIAAAFVPLPPTQRPAGAARERSLRAPVAGRARAGVALFALALAAYLCGQGAFLIWAPHDLETTFGVPARAAAGVVGAFWGPSIFGLVAAALIVTRFPPRRVLLGAAVLAVASLVAATAARDAHAFVVATSAFGFTSTCLFKLMISIGSEQIPDAPPVLVTGLLLSASAGGTIAPAISAAIVAVRGAPAGVTMALACYCATLAAAAAALLVERDGLRPARGQRSRGPAASR